jgi:glycerol-3-phosphate dehydrogenase
MNHSPSSSDKLQHCYDVLVVGGGINGVGIARDLAGRGLRVLLCEKDDLAAHTSSASSKLIHGGLRYLEFYEFQLVRKALMEREVLMRSAPHLITPLRFILPHVAGLRPRFILRAGLFLYDHLAQRELLPSSHSVRLDQAELAQVLQAHLKHGFAYSDAWVDDARLVAQLAQDAHERGAVIRTRTRLVGVHKETESWSVALQSALGGREQIYAKSIVNAAGAWASELAQLCEPSQKQAHLRLIKGSHIVVKRLFEHDQAYIFQHPDGRIVFALPYESKFTLIGTTDLEFTGDLDQVSISAQEIEYLCELSNQYFAQSIIPSDVLWSYAGVRPLFDDGHADAKSITRDYHLEMSATAPYLLNVFGGKITTFRRLAEQASTMLTEQIGGSQAAWTAQACLPGGDICGTTPNNQAVLGLEEFIQQMQQRYSWLPAQLMRRYVKAYGTRSAQLLDGCYAINDLGEQIVTDLYAKEVHYLRRFEFAQTAQDILWRRSKLGLHQQDAFSAEAILNAWLALNPINS